MKKLTIIGAKTKASRLESLTDNSPLHATSARQYPHDWQANSSSFHPRSTAARIRSIAKTFTQQDCEPSNQHQRKESQVKTLSRGGNNSQVDVSQLTNVASSIGQQPTKKPISSHLDQGLVNEDQHTYDDCILEAEVDHVHANPTNLQHDTNNGSNITKKRTRGPTVGLEWTKRRQTNWERVDVQLPPDLRRLVGYRAQELITKSGRYVRQHAPLTVEKWSEIPIDIIDKLVNIIYTEFNLPNESHVRGDLVSSFRRHYKIWRYHLHADYYLKWNTDAQRRANGPKDIDPAQWNWIVSYWSSAKFKRISEINKQNRSQQIMKSRVGSKSIARTIYEIREAPHEQDELPIYLRLWEKTHKGKHSEWQDETTEEIYKKLLELHDTQIKEKGEDKLTPEEAYTTVIGYRSGYILGMGPGPRPTERVRTNEQQLREQIRAEVHVEMNTRIQEMEDRFSKSIQEMQAMILTLSKQREPEDQEDSTNCH